MKTSLKRCEDAEVMKKITLSIIILAFVVSSVTLWLLESPLKPILYFSSKSL